MKHKLIALALTLALLASVTSTASAASDRDLAEAWVSENCPTAEIEVVKTKSIGHKKGKVIGTRYTVKYPKKVKRGKRVKVYIIWDGDDAVAMVCLGTVK